MSRENHAKREQWTKDNPDIVVFMHALRVELLVNYVMRRIVPETEAEPFQYWLRFEFGQSGNPHAHGLAYVNGNPQFDFIAKNQEALDAFIKCDHPDLKDIRLAEDAVKDVADFYDPYVREMHPCKDTAGLSLIHI